MYLSLVLVNREIGSEVSDLFRKLYADKLVLYFDDLLHIHWVWKNRERWPDLHDARFWSQVLLEDTQDEGDAKTDGALMLIDRQEGWKEECGETPGWISTDCIGPDDQFFPDLWDPVSDGFTRTIFRHEDCTSSSGFCVDFVQLNFPIMENGCKIKTYTWPKLNDDDPMFRFWGPGESGVMVLEGRLDALTFQNVPVELVRKRMACERQRKEEGRDNEPHDHCGCYDVQDPELDQYWRQHPLGRPGELGEDSEDESDESHSEDTSDGPDSEDGVDEVTSARQFNG